MDGKTKSILLFLIILGGFVVRLYRFDGPIADWHSWRQADTSSVSRNFIRFGFDLLHPRFDDLSNVPSGFDNPHGYRFVEFPLYNLLQAGSYKLFGIFTLEEWGRLISIFSSLAVVFFLYKIVAKYASSEAALLSAFFYSFLPYSIYYGRTILPDTAMIASIFAGIYFFSLWLDLYQKKDMRKQIIFFVLALLFTASSLLLKPYALFFTLPLLYLGFDKFGLTLFKKWEMWLFLILSILPLILWRLWMLQFPQGIPTNAWLFNGGNIRFKGAFFYWLFANRIARLILGYWGIFLFSLGLMIRKTAKFEVPFKNSLFLFSFLLSSLVYLFVIARGNVQHDYYQILIVPSIAIFVGLGSAFLLSAPSLYVYDKAAKALFIIAAFFTFIFGWYFIRDYFNINNPAIIKAGLAVDKLTPKNAKVIALYSGDTSFLYQTKRQGWASMEKPIPEMISMGADFLVISNPKSVDYKWAKTYKLIAKNSDYLIYNLRQKP